MIPNTITKQTIKLLREAASRVEPYAEVPFKGVEERLWNGNHLSCVWVEDSIPRIFKVGEKKRVCSSCGSLLAGNYIQFLVPEDPPQWTWRVIRIHLEHCPRR